MREYRISLIKYQFRILYPHHRLHVPMQCLSDCQWESIKKTLLSILFANISKSRFGPKPKNNATPTSIRIDWKFATQPENSFEFIRFQHYWNHNNTTDIRPTRLGRMTGPISHCDIFELITIFPIQSHHKK